MVVADAPPTNVRTYRLNLEKQLLRFSFILRYNKTNTPKLLICAIITILILFANTPLNLLQASLDFAIDYAAWSLNHSMS